MSINKDIRIYNLIKAEEKRQRESIELIPSENYTSATVLGALGSVLTNKYAEGYPGKRYYGGCNNIDRIEQLTIDRAKKLFGAEHVNVQPLSGAAANLAVYSSLLKPGDTILGMDLSHGGHLTHGHPVTFSAIIYHFIRYKTDKNGDIDFNEIEVLAKKYRPKLILAGYSAYTKDIDYKKIVEIAKSVSAYTMADIAHIAGIVSSGWMNNPASIFDVVTTTTHKTLRGPRGGMIMCKKELAQIIDRAVFPGLQGGPHENNIAGMAVAFGEALKPSFKKYTKQILLNAKALEEELLKLKYTLSFGGTQNHMLLIDLRNKYISGKEAQSILEKVGISVNKNMIPDDSNPPADPSGIRLGTPAVTTRGMKEKEMTAIVNLINDTLVNRNNKKVLFKIKKEVKALARGFPPPVIDK